MEKEEKEEEGKSGGGGGGGVDGGSGWMVGVGGRWLVPSDTNPPWQPN